jgi:hypothetical protein
MVLGEVVQEGVVREGVDLGGFLEVVEVYELA